MTALDELLAATDEIGHDDRCSWSYGRCDCGASRLAAAAARVRAELAGGPQWHGTMEHALDPGPREMADEEIESVYDVAVNVAACNGRNTSHLAGLRAVERAVRARK